MFSWTDAATIYGLPETKEEPESESGVVIVASIAFLSLYTAIFKCEDIHQSVEMKGRRQIGEGVTVGNWK